MTDKELLINGVNVANCEFRFRNYGCDCISSNNDIKISTASSRCADNPYYYYKQLQRKEQECEELKRQLKNSFEEKTILNTIIDRLLFNSGYNQCTASAEELEDVYADMEYKREAFEDYKQALGKIEEYCTIQQAYDGDLPFKTQLDDILDIINEVKDA